MTANRPPPSSTMISPKVATYQIVSRSRSRIRRWIPSRDDVASIAKAISGAAHRLDQLRRKLVVDLAAQAAHKHLEHVGEWIVVLVPDVSGYRRPVDNLPVVKNEELEQRELFRRQLNRFSRASHALGLQINFEI